MNDRPSELPHLPEARRTGPGVALQIDHAHQELELNLIISGKGTYFLDDGQHDLAPGTLVWLLPGQSHRLIRSPELDMWVILIAPGDVDPELVEDVARQPCKVLSTSDAVAIDRLLSHLSQHADEPRLYRAGLDYALRTAWYATINSPGTIYRPMHPAIARALSILRSSDETPTSTQLAKMCGVTQDYLGRLLLKHTGRGFVEWRNRTRLERFHMLFPESGDLLTAALDAGFGSYTQFHRVFCDLVGTTPGEWARSGAQAKSVALPSMLGEISGSDAESPRMAWYSLSEFAFPAASVWFTPAFALNFQRSTPMLGRSPAIDSGVTSFAELRAYEDRLIDQMRSADPTRAEKLARTFARNDVFAGYRGTIGHYGVNPADLSRLIGVYVALATAAAAQAPTPSFEKIDEVHARTRFALAASATFAKADLEERRFAAAAFVAMTAFLRSALVGSRASGSDAIALRMSKGAHATALQTLGLDVRAFDTDEFEALAQALAS